MMVRVAEDTCAAPVLSPPQMLDKPETPRDGTADMKFLNPCNDWAFKRIFGSAESRAVLLCFLNDLLHGGRPVIVEVTILDPYLPSRIRLLKDSAVDVRAKLADGTECIIEMQMFPVAGFTQRVLFNGAKCLASQLGRGHDYRRLRPVVVVTIADCILLHDTANWRSDFTLTEKKTRRPYPGGGINLIFVELPKANLSGLPDGEPMRDWLEFLKNAPNWRTVPRVLKNPGVRHALALARKDSLSPAESEIMSRRDLYRIDQKNMRIAALEEGLEKGLSRGLSQGLVKGESLAEQRIIQGMLRQKLAPEVIAAATGRPVNSILKLIPRKRAPRQDG